MNPLKKLLGQTAVYGVSTILARTANYVVLVPLYTYVFLDQAEFGINTTVYAYISLLNILLTYGFETAFFYFWSKREDKENVYSTSLISLIISTSVFLIAGIVFSGNIANAMDYAGQQNFIVWMVVIICSDAFMIIPFARLRSENKPGKYALIKCTNILINILLNVFFIIFCKNAYEADLISGESSFLGKIYDPSIGIGYGFLANALTNVFTLVFLFKEYTAITYHFDKKLWKSMMKYAMPLLVLGFAGMINETFDRIILGKMLDPSIAKRDVGIYGACYKLSIIMTIFIQAFKMAAEPFFFSTVKDKDSKKTNAQVTKYFVIFCSFIFLGTMMNIEWLKHFISEPFWKYGLFVVPILLIANLFLGVFYNLSIWYKLTEQTKFGAYLTIVGAVITLTINFAFIPGFGFAACAWATLISYGVMMVLSYLIGKKHYPIKYNLRSMGFFFFAALGLYFISLLYKGRFPKWGYEVAVNNVLLLFFVWLFYILEYPNLKKKENETVSESSEQG
ncbi:MAG: oligosaccharide flippase family protein [Bacteroidia bacterium]|nr:oligosaccharide flippase family protein [Bacteroidia bacterium]